MKNYLSKTFCLISLTIQKIQIFSSEGKITGEFVGLMSRLYTMKNIAGKESNTIRVNIETDFNKFKDTLFNKKIIRHKMRRIQGKKHKMRTYEINKISLSWLDDKRIVLHNGIYTLACLHKDLKNRFSQMIINKKRFEKILTNIYK